MIRMVVFGGLVLVGAAAAVVWPLSYANRLTFGWSEMQRSGVIYNPHLKFEDGQAKLHYRVVRTDSLLTSSSRSESERIVPWLGTFTRTVALGSKYEYVWLHAPAWPAFIIALALPLCLMLRLSLRKRRSKAAPTRDGPESEQRAPACGTVARNASPAPRTVICLLLIVIAITTLTSGIASYSVCPTVRLGAMDSPWGVGADVQEGGTRVWLVKQLDTPGLPSLSPWVLDPPRHFGYSYSAYTMDTVDYMDSSRNGRHHYRRIDILFPVWLVPPILAIYPTIAFYRGPVRRRRHRKRGLCISCGYNLRGNESGICPECATEVDQQ